MSWRQVRKFSCSWRKSLVLIWQSGDTLSPMLCHQVFLGCTLRAKWVWQSMVMRLRTFGMLPSHTETTSAICRRTSIISGWQQLHGSRGWIVYRRGGEIAVSMGTTGTMIVNASGVGEETLRALINGCFCGRWFETFCTFVISWWFCWPAWFVVAMP